MTPSARSDRVHGHMMTRCCNQHCEYEPLQRGKQRCFWSSCRSDQHSLGELKLCCTSQHPHKHVYRHAWMLDGHNDVASVYGCLACHGITCVCHPGNSAGQAVDRPGTASTNSTLISQQLRVNSVRCVTLYLGAYRDLLSNHSNAFKRHGARSHRV